MALFIILLACAAALCQGSTIPRYDWHDDSSPASAHVYRPLTSDTGLAKRATLDSAAAGVVGGRVPSLTDDANGGRGDADDKDDDFDGSFGFSVDNLSEEKRRLLTEILSTVYEDDALDLDVLGSSKKSDGSSYEDDDDDKSSDDKAEEIIADILTTGSTDPTGTPTSSSTGAAGMSAMDLAYRQYQKAVRVFSAAETEALEAELAFTDAEAVVATAASQAVARASEEARTLAVNTIAAARAEARSDVLASRQRYVSAVVEAHSKIALMKTAERRFKSLLVTFAKARTYAGVSILGVKKCASDLAEAKAKRLSYDQYAQAYSTAVATAKTRVGKMKVVEKRIFLMAKALARARAEAFACKLKVRKMGYRCATTCAVASAKVHDAISAATSSVSQAIALASATANVKAESILEAADKAKAKSQDDVQSARLAVAEAKAQVEAVAAAQTTSATQAAAASANSISGDDDDDSGYSTDVDTLSSAPAMSDVQVAAQSASASTAGTDATDTKAYY